MRLLVLSFYYRPDLCAGSFRATALMAALRERAPPGTMIDLITTLPNRYHTFTAEAPEHELEGNVQIHRIRLPSHRSDMLGQSKAYARFARAALRLTRRQRYDVVLATSSRLMTASLGAWIARRSGARLYLDIRDIFVDTMGDILPRMIAAPVSLAFSLLESWTIRRADRVNLVSPGFESYFSGRYGKQRFSWFTNGIDDEFLEGPVMSGCGKRTTGRATILYAGNIGEGQALHRIIPALAVKMRERARFVVIGDGGRRGMLAAALAAAGADNVELRAPMTRSELLTEYRRADVLFLHLADVPAFERVLPSKIFEYASLGKPILAGVAGYAASFLEEQVANAAVFPPCGIGEAVHAFERLTLEDRERPEFMARYARRNIVRAMADDVLALVEKS